MTQFLRPDSNITQTNFTGGYADIDETSPNDTDKAYPNANGARTLEVGLSNPAQTPVGGDSTIRYRLFRVSTSTGSPNSGIADSATLSLYQGATLVASDTTRSTGSATAIAYSWTLNTATIADWNDLRLRLTEPSQSGSGLAISFAEMEAPDGITLAGGAASVSGGSLSLLSVTFISLAGGAVTVAGGVISLAEKVFSFVGRGRVARSIKRITSVRSRR